jgi:thioredoxin 2
MEKQPQLIRCPACGRENRVRPAARGAPHCGACGAPLPWLVESGDEDFVAVAEESSLPVLLDFWAPWCGPCQMVSPLVERMAEALRGQLKVVKVNTDTAPAVSQRFRISGIPTLMILDHGNEVARVTGALNAAALRNWVEGHLPSRKQAS